MVFIQALNLFFWIIPPADHLNTEIRVLKIVDTRSLRAEDAWWHGLVRHDQHMHRRKAYCNTDILVDCQLKPL